MKKMFASKRLSLRKSVVVVHLSLKIDFKALNVYVVNT